MRTTVDISDGNRAQLAGIAASRGLKGISELVNEAIVYYLMSDPERERRGREALALCGSLSEEEAEGLRSNVAELRKNW